MLKTFKTLNGGYTLKQLFFIYLRKILKNISRGFNARAITIAGPAIFLQFHTIRERLTAIPRNGISFGNPTSHWFVQSSKLGFGGQAVNI